MKILKNSGTDRVVDELRNSLLNPSKLDLASPQFSLFAFGELKDALGKLDSCRIILPSFDSALLSLTGSDSDREFRNSLQLRWLAKECYRWIENKADLRKALGSVPQAAMIASSVKTRKAFTGSCNFTTEGLGITPGNQFGLVQSMETDDECDQLSLWFSNQWNALTPDGGFKKNLLAEIERLIADKPPALIYYLILFQIFKDMGHELDEERIVKSGTGIKNTNVWKKLYKFQRDGVIGAIDKLERLGGCIIADSVGLGKTFEALAVIKYYELRNDRVLVLAPKRLRDNWTLYKANDKRNILAADRFHYDVLNHTDLGRETGLSGDIDLSNINWGNYDLVVIDESHNFRNKSTHKVRETRYDLLMKRIIQAGVKTRVLMLSATPVNNRLADLKNQIVFVTEGDDGALAEQGITSIESTVRKAQLQFNRWLGLDESERKPSLLMDMLGFDYFKLLDLLTIARSRKHIEKYYGTDETGKFPERLKPKNIKPDVDKSGAFRSIREINNEIRHLNLSVYAPLRYVLPSKKALYDAKYSTQIRGGEGFFRQADREESLIHLMRINVLKRMESSISSFALTLSRQLADVLQTIEKLDAQQNSFDEIEIDDVVVDDPTFESLLVGRKVKVLLQDVDVVRWRQDLVEDRDKLQMLLSTAKQVNAARDAKLAALKEIIAAKASSPINDGNKKIIIFTAFSDTAKYLYEQLSPWIQAQLSLHSAMVTGGGSNKTTLPNLRNDFASILTAFSPRSKQRPEELSDEGNVDILFATDCISEGQNLQDCDTLINYDIHWNPVRIIQRFGRIDRIGSINDRIQLINFWPNIELEEYINLEQRVSGRMVLLDISATGEENVIEEQSGNQMNDLEYRKKQLLKLQDAVIDLEDLNNGISIADLTLTDFRIDLSTFLKDGQEQLEKLAKGTFAVVTCDTQDESIGPGIVFCLKAVGDAAITGVEPGYPLAPYYLVHISNDGSVVLPFNRAKPILDKLKKLCVAESEPNVEACRFFDKVTRDGKEMSLQRDLLSKSISSIVGRKEERAIASLFTSGGTHAKRGEFQGINDFEVIAYLAILEKTGIK